MTTCKVMIRLLLLAVFHVGSAAAENDRPIIGILTQPLGIELSDRQGLGPKPPHFPPNETYLVASYVKFVESAGARVVPVHYDASDEELKQLFKQLNGILFPGGGADIKKGRGNRFREASELLYNLALEANDNGDAFPIHGTCLGFQMMGLMAAGDDSLMSDGFKAEGIPLNLDFTPAATTSKLFAAMPPALVTALKTQNITANSHSQGFDPAVFESNSKLKGFYNVLSTNVDTNGKPFVSTFEARRYPFSATQWHPEKNNFEWGTVLGPNAIPHSAEAVRVSQFIADVFVSRARQSSHRFESSDAESKALIYNSVPQAMPGGYFMQVYMWKKRSEREHESVPLAAPVVV